MKTGVLFCVLLAVAQPASAAWKDEILAAHNAVRAAVHVPPLAWSDTLAEQARSWAEFLAGTGTIAHSPGWMLAGEGENIWMGGGARFKPDDMVGMWADEQAWYHGEPVGRGRSPHLVGHYTQIVWRGTTRVGCGYVAVPDKLYVQREYLVCRYSPPGNIIGQRPY